MDKDFVRQKLNLATVPFEGEHMTAGALQQLGNENRIALGIEDAEIVETIDGGSNFQKASRNSGHPTLHCTTHVLQLPVNNALQFFAASVGEPFSISCWQKKRLLNGKTNTLVYEEQFFGHAFKFTFGGGLRF